MHLLDIFQAHTHLGIISYLCKLTASNPGTLSNARTNILFGFINCLSNNNYSPEPDEWLEIQKQISENPVLDGKNAALPWTKICLELASLGHYDDKLLDRVFSQENIDDFMARENNALDLLQLLTLYEAVRAFHDENFELPPDLYEKAKSVYPVHRKTELLEEHLAQGLGGPEYVVRNVVLQNGFIAGKLKLGNFIREWMILTHSGKRWQTSCVVTNKLLYHI